MSEFDLEAEERIKAYRDRAVLELLLRLPAGLSPGKVWDLGCGDGEYTAMLARRYPAARVHGLDAAPAALAKARGRGAIDWTLSRVEDFDPPAPAGLIFCNSVLHLLDDHAGLLRGLAIHLIEGGVLAVQTALSYGGPVHQGLKEAAAAGPWGGILKAVKTIRPSLSMEAYHYALSPICAQIDIWTTRYLVPLEPRDAVIDWAAGAGLAPYLDALPDLEMRRAFMDAARQTLEQIYPRRPDGRLLLPVERLFIVAVR